MVRQLQPWVAIVALPFVLLLCYIMVYVTQKTDIEGRPTYEYAGFRYESHARFDNTWPTYSTDYVITFVLLIQGFMISNLKLEDAYKPLQKLILQLLALYGGSTLVGGIAHHMYDGRVSSLNTNEFYLMWITVLGCTAVAGGCQGLIGDELLAVHGSDKMFAKNTWMMWNYLLLLVIVFGGFSCARPACDIFLVGVTQSVPVFYLQFCLYKTCYLTKSISPELFWCLFVGAIFNAPLIVLYPYLLDMYGASITNVILHSNLLVSWGSQGVGYYYALSTLKVKAGSLRKSKVL